ncbi:MAG: DUF4412 domain-containing protein [candidate division Zixibacteria bacterium]|nr:DUF4412 domain-containing protein [candidate division Zixibacteria bacterium]
MKTRMILITLAIFVIAVCPASADWYLKQVNYTGAMEIMGQTQPARYDTSETWITKGMVYSKSSEGDIFIAREDEGKAYSIDNKGKTYSEMPINMKDILDPSEKEASKKKAEKVAGMMGSVECTVTPTKETKEIKSWDAKKYAVTMNIAMMKTSMDVWATEDIEIDADLFNLAARSMMSQLPGFEDMINEMKKIKGVSVLSEGKVDMMGNKVDMKTELIECTEKSAPDGIFDIPKGYKKVEMKNPMGGR